jgi:hypothetical protein
MPAPPDGSLAAKLKTTGGFGGIRDVSMTKGSSSNENGQKRQRVLGKRIEVWLESKRLFSVNTT